MSTANTTNVQPDSERANEAYFAAMRLLRLGHEERLEETLDLLSQSVLLTPMDNPKLAERRMILAALSLEWCSLNPSRESLVRAFTNMARARELIPPTHPLYPVYIENLETLRNCQFQQYQMDDNPQDLRDAIDLSEQILRDRAADGRTKLFVRAGLAQLYGQLFEHDKQNRYLDLGVGHGRQALEEATLPPSDRAHFFGSLAQALSNRYKHVGTPADLDEAILNGEAAVNNIGEGDGDRPKWLNNLGLSYELRFEKLGNPTDLEHALQYTERSLGLTPPDDPSFPRRTNNLANQLGHRFELTGESEYLNTAIEKLRAVTDPQRSNASDYAAYLNNLSFLLMTRFQRELDFADVDEAIQKSRLAVNTTPEGHADLPRYCNGLGNGLRIRSDRDTSGRDIDEAIRCGEEAHRLSTDNPFRNTWLANLLLSYLWRFREKEAPGDLEKAIKLTEESLSSPGGLPDRASQLLNLGNMSVVRSSLLHLPNDLDTALEYFKEAATMQSAYPLRRVQASRRAIRILQQRGAWDEMKTLAENAMELLPMVCGRYLSRKDQQQAVIETSSLAADVCSILLRGDQVEQALQQLEFGKAILIGYTIDNHDDLKTLEATCSDLAERYRDLRNQLYLQPMLEGSNIGKGQMKIRRNAAYRMEECLAEIHRIRGHEDFLRGLSTEKMKACASEGPIVVVNLTDISSDAIVVSPSQVQRIPLPKLRAGGEMPAFVSSALRNFRSPDREFQDFLAGRDVGGEDEGAGSVTTEFFLSWLWESCVEVVLDALGPRPTAGAMEHLPRVWWIGAGVASGLPFHAASLSANKYKPDNNALDRMVPSYTPSIKALSYSREKSKQYARTPHQQPRVTVVTMTTTPGYDGLDGVQPESDLIKEKCDSSGVYTCVPLPQPTVDAVLESMGHSEIVHFACHGKSHSRDPSRSHLLLQKHDEAGRPKVDELTVSRISSADRAGLAWIAYLSACSTAQISAAKFADEGIHISSALQVAGFAHVVGCLWRVEDSVRVEVAGYFYDAIIGRERRQLDNRDVAEALRTAVLRVRGEHPDPQQWGAYIHSGA
ncbi:CHAT domain-containing protein [Cladophialophora immunda]|nr:CHAT domain-containing protein [Cladophialophora immunda]